MASKITKKWKRDRNGNTELHHAVKLHQFDLLKKFIETGSNVNAKNNKGDSPLAMAIQQNQIDSVRTLISAGAIHDFKYFTKKHGPLHLAAACGAPDMIDLLIAAGVEVNAVDEQKLTPLHIFTAKAFRKNVPQEDICRIMDLLVQAGADLSATDFSGKTPLFNAYCEFPSEIFKFIISLRPGIRRTLDFKYLDQAVQKHDLNKMKMLIELGININLRGSDGCICLHKAFYYANCDMINLLLKNGSLLNVMNREGFDPLCYGIKSWGQNHLGTNLDADQENNEDSLAQMRALELLLNRAYDVNGGRGNKTPLYVSLEYNVNPSITLKHLKHGAKFDVDHPIIKTVLNTYKKFNHARVLLQHVVMFHEKYKLDFNGLNQRCKNEYLKCQKELENLKEKTVENTTVSFFKILVDPDIGPYTRNEDIIKVFENLDAKEYPTYGDLLTERFSNELEHQRLVEEAKKALSYVLQWDENSFPVIINNVLGYLDKNDFTTLSSI